MHTFFGTEYIWEFAYCHYLQIDGILQIPNLSSLGILGTEPDHFPTALQTSKIFCGNRRKCSLRAFSPFPTVFSKDLYCRHVKIRACCRKGLINVYAIKLYLVPFIQL